MSTREPEPTPSDPPAKPDRLRTTGSVRADGAPHDPATGPADGAPGTDAAPGGEGASDAGAPTVPAEPTGPTSATRTRTGAVFVGSALGALILLLLLIFILQNLDDVRLKFLFLKGNLPVGVALLLAAVAGALVVAIAGGGRILQLRRRGQRWRK